MTVGTEVVREQIEFRLGRELAAVEEEHDLLEGAFLNEILDVVTEIAKDAFLALHVTEA
jgi:hypothetical protein